MKFVSSFFVALTFLFGMVLWFGAPQYYPPLLYQSKAIFTFSLSLTLFSCLLLSLGPRLMEMLKVLAFLLLTLTFILSLEPFYLIFLEAKWLYLKLRIYYPVEIALSKTVSWLDTVITKKGMAYLTWFVTSSFCLVCLMSLFRLLVLVPIRRLFLDRSYRVKEGPWNSGFLEKAKEKQLLNNKKGLPLGVMSHQSGMRGTILRYLPNAQKGWLGGNQDMGHTKGGSTRSYTWPWMRMVCRSESLLQQVPGRIARKLLNS